MPDYLPKRIVCLQPSATAILRDLGALDRVIACTRYCVDVCPEAAQGRTVVPDSWTVHAEEITRERPDLVIAAIPFQQESLAQILKAGCRFLALAPKTLADIYVDITIIAGTVGLADRGRALAEHMRTEIESLREKSKVLPRRRVFCEEWGKPLIASQPWVAELVEAAGGEFVTEPGKQIDSDSIRNLNPDVLIAAWCGAGDRVPLEKIVETRGWQELKAVKSGHVYCIPDEYLNTPAPTLLKGLHAIAAAVHAESFPEAAGLRRIQQR